jgi:branched-chain amino acid transport system ATP-binding protein
MALLAMRDVRAGYGGGPDILGGVSLDVEEGSTFGVIGPNGAGKSTVLKAIMGLVDVRAGDIEFAGESLRGRRADEVLARGVCFVPQDRSLFPEMTVRENLAMAGYSLGRRADLDARIGEALDAFPVLAELRSQRARTLSGGQQQMLALARAWILKPRLLLVDEPSMGLAPQVTRQVFDVIRGFRELGMTVLLVEQNARQGLECADRGVVLDLGRTRFAAAADTILTHPDVRELYLGKQLARGTNGGAAGA